MYAVQIFIEGKSCKWDDFHNMGSQETNVASIAKESGTLQFHSEITTSRGKYPHFQEGQVNRDIKFPFFPGRGGGYSSEFLVGVCRPVPQILTQFQTKRFHFQHPFSDLASEIHTRFQAFVAS